MEHLLGDEEERTGLKNNQLRALLRQRGQLGQAFGPAGGGLPAGGSSTVIGPFSPAGSASQGSVGVRPAFVVPTGGPSAQGQQFIQPTIILAPGGGFQPPAGGGTSQPPADTGTPPPPPPPPMPEYPPEQPPAPPSGGGGGGIPEEPQPELPPELPPETPPSTRPPAEKEDESFFALLKKLLKKLFK